MIKHKRRPDYWVYYHLGHCTETAFLIDMITNLVRENPCPHQEKSNRGRPPVHSRAKLDFICILMVAMAQDLPRYGKRLVRDKDTVGRRASPPTTPPWQTPPDHFAGLVGYYPDQDCHAVRCREQAARPALWGQTAAAWRPPDTRPSPDPSKVRRISSRWPGRRT